MGKTFHLLNAKKKQKQRSREMFLERLFKNRFIDVDKKRYFKKKNLEIKTTKSISKVTMIEILKWINICPIVCVNILTSH